MRFALLLAAFTLAACQTTAAPEATAPPVAPFYTLIDLTDDYVRFYDRTEGMETAARVAAFKAEMNPLFPGFYDMARLEGVSAERYDGMIANSFQQFPETRARYLATSANFGAMIEPARVAFVSMFPDAQPIGDIYFVHSLGEMDGGTREIGDTTYAIFGADVIARYQTPGNEQPFFHHELFHFYHQNYFSDPCDAVWCSLWSEGLAVYVASEMNPGASDVALALTLPRPIRPEVDANREYAICETAKRLDSESMDDYRPLFFGNANLERLPPRAGYYIGYLVVREAGRSHSVQDLAHLGVAEARPVLDAALASLATCPPAN